MQCATFELILITKKIVRPRAVHTNNSIHLLSIRSALEGFYVEDALQGQGLYTYEDGTVLHGTYVDGELNGPAQECDAEGHLMFKGQYKDNNRCGECWIYYPVSQLSAHSGSFCITWFYDFKLFRGPIQTVYRTKCSQKPCLRQRQKSTHYGSKVNEWSITTSLVHVAVYCGASRMEAVCLGR